MLVEDSIEKIIGPTGKYQMWILFLIVIARYPNEFQLNIVVFILPNAEYVCMDDNAYNITNHCPCLNPKYDQSTIISSVTSEWDLICDRTYLASLAQSILQVGILVGSLIYGHVSDRYGRKIAVLLAVFLNAVFITLSALMPELWMFMVCRFLIGTTTGATMLCCYIHVIELCGKSFRPYMVGLNEIAYVSGYFFLPIIAYFVREWRHLQLVTSAPWLLVIFYYWLIPESPRWLTTVGRKKEAIEILTHIAKRNSRPTNNIEAIVNELENDTETQQQKTNYIDLFKTPKIRLYSIVMALIWMLCAHTFFGVNQYIGRLQGNLYLNVMLSAVSLVPGVILMVLAGLILSRRMSVFSTFAVAGASLLTFLFIPDDMHAATLTFAIIGYTGIYTSFVLIYLYASEVFPTSIRNSAMGFASMFARFGSFIAPFVVNIGVEWITILIFSVLAFSAAFLCYLLPETKGTTLLNTIDQSEKANDKNKTPLE